MTEKVYSRATDLMLLAGEPGRWNCQRPEQYPRFPVMHRNLTERDVRDHLLGRHWIACRLPADGITDRIVVDLDAKNGRSLEERNEIYRTVRDAFGRDRTPLVWRTPSGAGLRLAYRIPRTRMSELTAQAAAEATAGLVPEVLRAAGVEPRLGTLEIYPAANRADRQLFGRRMPLLDPESLEPISGADPSERYSEAQLRRAVDLAEAWYEDVQADLLAQLHNSPRVAQPVDAASAGPEPLLAPNHGIKPSAATTRLIRDGLREPSTRYASEFQVGIAMWLWPEEFADLGLPTTPDREDVARALAEWLARRTNGLSKEWTASLRRRGREGARDEWTRRYLRRNRTDGLAPVDRMRRAAASASSSGWATCHLTTAERDEILRIARRACWSGKLGEGAELYKFVVWASTCIRVAKRQMQRSGTSGDVERSTAQIAAEWQRGWPFGRRYVEYRSILVEAGFMRLVTPPLRNPVPDLPGTASVYEFHRPDWCRIRDLPMEPREVRRRISSLRAKLRTVSIDEAYHALYVADSGLDAKRIFGRRTAERIERYIRALRPPSLLAVF